MRVSGFWMLAEVSEAATQHDWLTIICSVGSLAVSVVIMIVVLANKSQKREVSFSFEPASKVEFEKHIAENKREHEKFTSNITKAEEKAEAKLGEAIASGNVSREKLHNRINDLMSAIARLEGKLGR